MFVYATGIIITSCILILGTHHREIELGIIPVGIIMSVWRKQKTKNKKEKKKKGKKNNNKNKTA